MSRPMIRLALPSSPLLPRLAAVTLLTALVAACAGPQPQTQASRHHGFMLPTQPRANVSPGTPSPAELADNPDRFKGMAYSDVSATLGEPDFVRKDPPAEIWQYYGQGCVLDLFLYSDTTPKKVSYVDLRSRIPGQLPDADCLPKLLAGERQSPTS